MDIRYEKIRDKDDQNQGEVKLKNEGKEGQQARQQEPPSTSSAESPPSASSSPSHEFSFTISVHPSGQTAPNKTKSPPPFAVDLSPADEIFFHGHLLPLHLLSHLPVSPRSSTNSLDSFTLPIKDFTEDKDPNQMNNNINGQNQIDHSNFYQRNDYETKPRVKSKSFSFFGLPKWRKTCEVKEKEEHEKHKKKLRFDVSQVLKRYIRMVRPVLSFRSRRENNHFQRQSYYFSGNTSFREKEVRGRRIQYSAPASIRTSPTNSGPLLATGNIPTSTSDSTMEELQAAIQAAIAHCKNSISMEEKKKNHD